MFAKVCNLSLHYDLRPCRCIQQVCIWFHCLPYKFILYEPWAEAIERSRAVLLDTHGIQYDKSLLSRLPNYYQQIYCPLLSFSAFSCNFTESVPAYQTFVQCHWTINRLAKTDPFRYQRGQAFIYNTSQWKNGLFRHFSVGQ